MLINTSCEKLKCEKIKKKIFEGYLFQALGIKKKTMLMKRYILLFLLAFTAHNLNAQQQAHGKLKSTRDANLHVIRFQPDSYPQVALTFHATDAAGNPVWNIDKNDVRVTENGQQAKVVQLRPLTADNGLHTMLVVDHSGSMAYDQTYYEWLLSLPIDSAHPDTVYVSYKYVYDPVNPEKYKTVKLAKDSAVLQYHYVNEPDFSWYKSPMYYAQQASIQYIKSMKSPADKVGVIGFSDYSDLKIYDCKADPQYRHKILGMNAEGATAFYDGVDEALRSLVTHKGHRAVVALTDGQDNSSSTSLDALINLAKKLKIPVYVVGLGNVDSYPLQRLAIETGGEYHYTNDPKQLNTLFLRISSKIKAVYELVYKSPFLTSVTPAHDVQLTFDVDTAFLKTQLFELPLPESVIRELVVRESQPTAALQPEADVLEAQIAAQEAVRFEKEAPPEQQAEFPYGLLIASVSVAGAGSLLVKSRYGKKKPAALQLQNVFPNPASGPVTLSYIADIASGPVAVHLLNNSGQPVLTESLDFSGTHQLDVSAFPAGNYYVQLSAANGTSVLPLIVQH
jgi:Mg-chelatase subunit ChlD